MAGGIGLSVGALGFSLSLILVGMRVVIVGEEPSEVVEVASSKGLDSCSRVRLGEDIGA